MKNNKCEYSNIYKNIRLNIKFVYLSIVWIMIGSLCSCNKEQIKEPSFGGITIGKQFPDSLKKLRNFKFDNTWVPSYCGFVKFKFPSGYSTNIQTTIKVDSYNDSEVYEILLSELGYSQISDFYDLFLAKYGSPSATVSRNAKSYLSLLDYASKHIDELPKHRETSVPLYYITLAEWNPTNTNTVIQIFTWLNFDYTIDRHSVYIRYLNPDLEKEFYKEYTKEYSEKNAEEERIKEKNYRDKNKEVLEQDF